MPSKDYEANVSNNPHKDEGDPQATATTPGDLARLVLDRLAPVYPEPYEEDDGATILRGLE